MKPSGLKRSGPHSPKVNTPDLTGMAAIAGGRFTMGSDRHYPEEAPARAVIVDAFWMDLAPVTNAQFARFVDQTGYRTLAEQAPDPRDYPDLAAEFATPGSLVFHKTDRPVSTTDPSQWWRFVAGADWRRPLGPDSSVVELADHPVVQIAYADAKAFAAWAGKDLPTEAEWEFAARGGLENAEFAWGEALAPDGRMMANYWQGLFPFANQALDGFERTSPVRTYPANGYGLFDMIGNVWEWTKDWYGPAKAPSEQPSCCAIKNPRGARRSDSLDLAHGGPRIGRKVLKGGSHLCAENYCRRYRPPARHPQAVDSPTSHIGFRCVARGPA
jgi:sulfatase modifying factor 1